MKTSLFNYELPKKLIAQEPIKPRDHSKLMVINRKNGKISHHRFYELPKFLTKNDCLVFNKTKVFPARIFAKKETGGKIEILFLEEKESNIWEVINRPGLKISQKVIFKEQVFTCVGHKDQITLLKTNLSKDKLLKLLKEEGHTPLPPYIKSSEKESTLRKIYQTVYAQKTGSVAAPTAGFHFTKSLIQKLKKKGVQMEYVTLHVGLGTFAPVKVKEIIKHKMHQEYFEVDDKTINRLNKAKKDGKRIVSVGTTTTRVLETLSNKKGVLTLHYPLSTTELYIFPPYRFKFVDTLITNFHLPKSTLLMMVSAFVSSPNTKTLFKSYKKSIVGKAYQEAINKNYRFYSFGDASLIT